MIDTENVPTALRRPAVLQALEELIVLAQTAEERVARLNWTISAVRGIRPPGSGIGR